MSVRIKPGDDWGDSWGSGPGPESDDRVPDPQDVRAVFADDDGDSDEWGAPRPARASWWGGGRPQVPKLVAGALIAVVVMIVLGGLAYRLSVPAPVTPAETVAAAPGPSPVTSVRSPESTPTPTPDSADLTSMPWQGAALPISESSGPFIFTDHRATGFAQDPQGAALAAVHISTHIDPYTGPRVFTPTIDEQVIEGGDLLAQTMKQYEAAAEAQGLAESAIKRGAPVLAPTGEIAAWRIRNYRPDATTTVELLVHTPQGRSVVYEVPVVWDDDDWRVTFAGSQTGPVLRVTAAAPGAESEFEPFNTRGK
ncbi:MAG: hypothetical protein V9E98_01605 [Candidatus Nanopelagicales bacterium]